MSRKGENIYKRKDGRWEGRYLKGYDADGKAKYGYVYAKSYRETRQKLIESRQIPMEIYTKDIRKLTFSQLATQWLGYIKRNVKESSYTMYEGIVWKHLLIDLGEFKLSELSNQVLEAYLLQNVDSIKAGVLLCLYTGIRIGELCALKWKNIDLENEQIEIRTTMQRIRNTEGASPGKLQAAEKTQTEKMPAERSQTEKILREKEPMDEMLTGKIQMDKLQREKLQMGKTQMTKFTNGSINGFPKTKIIITTPKTKSSIRNIPLPKKIVNVLRMFQSGEDDYFLTGSSIKYLEPRTIQYRFKKYLRDCHIPDTNFHTLRHTFATRCVELGFEIKSLSEILGHSNVNITLNRYVHSSMEMKRENMSKLHY